MSRHTTVACRNRVGTGVTWGYHWDDPQVMAGGCLHPLICGPIWSLNCTAVLKPCPFTSFQNVSFLNRIDFRRCSLPENLKRMACRAEVVTTSRESNMIHGCLGNPL